METNFIEQYLQKCNTKNKIQFTDKLLANEAEKLVWKYIFTETTTILRNDDNFETYDIRNKMFAFYFTLFEVMGEYRSYFLLLFEQKSKAKAVAENFSVFESLFKKFVKALFAQGIETGEVAKRIGVQNIEIYAFIHKLRWLLRVWITDKTAEFEQTDVAIEKAVHFMFDLLAPSLLDSGFNFTKYLFQYTKINKT